jgi:pimeloyl-ACP methyl ester carboxylesterase
MTTFIFLHGSFHAAWNWHKVIPMLERAGHRGIALDMPGHGRDETPLGRVTLQRCVDRVLEALEQAAGKVVLVAHSRNGIVISEAAERRPEKIAGLVYLAAYLVPHGLSMMDYAVLDRESVLVQNVVPPFDEGRVRTLIRLARGAFMRWMLGWLLPSSLKTHALAPSAYREALYHDCPDEIVDLADALLEPEASLPGFTPLVLSPERYGRVPKVYVECTQDRAVTIGLQRRMLADTPCDRVFSLETSHSPFFSTPGALVDVLVESLGTFTEVAA